MITVVFLSGNAFAGSRYERPKIKLSFGSGWSDSDIGHVILISPEIFKNYPGKDDLYNNTDSKIETGVYHNYNRDFNGHLQLGYNFHGPWYVDAGLSVESKDQIGIPIHNFVTPVYRESYINLSSIMPYIAIEYTNRIWKLDYHTLLGLALSNTRADVKVNNSNIGIYRNNSLGVLVSGGLGYELFRFTSIKASVGYRFFGGDRNLKPPDDVNYESIIFNYDGVFYGIGMSYGFRAM
jgi:hypothetical protein